MRKIFLHPGNNKPLLEECNPNMEDDADKDLQAAADLASKDNENLLTSQKELLK